MGGQEAQVSEQCAEKSEKDLKLGDYEGEIKLSIDLRRMPPASIVS